MYNLKTRKKRRFNRKSGSNHIAHTLKNSRKKGASTIDPQRLINKGAGEEIIDFVPSRTFNSMPLHDRLKQNLSRKGYTEPTQIQDETLELLTAGRDLVGVANTGTGKTGAFLIPVINQLLNNEQRFTTLVIVPTRELALQVEDEFKSLARGLKIYASSFIGGTSVGRDVGQLKRKPHVIIGTPGRLMDLKDRGALQLDQISTLVLDEFDRMLDMGFVNDIKKIVHSMTSRKQTMLFSATIDNTQKSLISRLLHNAVEVKVSAGDAASDQIEQDIIRVPHGADKFNMLLDLIGEKEFEKVLIFAETKRLVDRVNKKLRQSGVKTDLIHGDKSQGYRNKALSKFKKGNVQVLVATDVAARGIDVTDISHVINYQLPMTFDSYVHRIGRTGRAGKRGKAFTFVD